MLPDLVTRDRAARPGCARTGRAGRAWLVPNFPARPLGDSPLCTQTRRSGEGTGDPPPRRGRRCLEFHNPRHLRPSRGDGPPTLAPTPDTPPEHGGAMFLTPRSESRRAARDEPRRPRTPRRTRAPGGGGAISRGSQPLVHQTVPRATDTARAGHSGATRTGRAAGGRPDGRPSSVRPALDAPGRPRTSASTARRALCGPDNGAPPTGRPSQPLRWPPDRARGPGSTPGPLDHRSTDSGGDPVASGPSVRSASRAPAPTRTHTVPSAVRLPP